MSRVSSRVRVLVAAEVVLLITFSEAEVRERLFLPDTLLLMAVPSIEARVAVRAVKMALSTLLSMPGFLLSAFRSPSSAFRSPLSAFRVPLSAFLHRVNTIEVRKLMVNFQMLRLM